MHQFHSDISIYLVLARNQVAILRRTIIKHRKYLELISLLQPNSRLLAKQTSCIIRISGTDHH